jgi:hypothetical protein
MLSVSSATFLRYHAIKKLKAVENTITIIPASNDSIEAPRINLLIEVYIRKREEAAITELWNRPASPSALP